MEGKATQGTIRMMKPIKCYNPGCPYSDIEEVGEYILCDWCRYPGGAKSEPNLNNEKK